jgi:diguanylate cyclase (GGDEF)-like protein
LASLLDLGGVLVWYARQISSILDDPVTGLAGRAEFQASLNHAFETARESGQPLSLLFVNPDDFTAVNENNGHEAGDRVLREIGERLSKTQRASDAIAKYGGAIFASFLPDTHISSARIVAEKIWSRLSEARYLDGSVRLGISVGVAEFDPEKQDVEGPLELIRRADKALNAAKRFGGDHVVAWDPELEAKDLGSLDRMTGVYTGNMAKDYRNMTLLSETMTAVAGSGNVRELADRVVERLFNILKADRISFLEWRDDAFEVLKSLTRTPDGADSTSSSEPFGLQKREKKLIEDARRERRPVHAWFPDGALGKKVLSFAVPPG